MEAVLVRRVIIGDGSCRCEGLEGIPVIGGLVGVVAGIPTTDDGLSSAVIWMLLDIITGQLSHFNPTSECVNSHHNTNSRLLTYKLQLNTTVLFGLVILPCFLGVFTLIFTAKTEQSAFPRRERHFDFPFPVIGFFLILTFFLGSRSRIWNRYTQAL